MKKPAKPRPTQAPAGGWLTALPYEKQREIVDWVRGAPLQEVCGRIEARLGISATVSSLARFVTWWHLSRRFEQAAVVADGVEKAVRDAPELGGHAEMSRELAQIAFELQVLEESKVAGYCSLRRLEQKDRDQELARRRLQLLETEASRPGQSALSPEEKGRRIREIFGLPE